MLLVTYMSVLPLVPQMSLMRGSCFGLKLLRVINCCMRMTIFVIRLVSSAPVNSVTSVARSAKIVATPATSLPETDFSKARTSEMSWALSVG